MSTLSRFDVSGRVAIITGGGGLLGREYARVLTEAGANVVVADIDFAAAAQAAAAADNSGGPGCAIAVPVDVTDEASVQAMADATLQQFERIDILVNNAALDPKFDATQANTHAEDFEHYPRALWRRSLDVDVTGVFLCCQSVAPAMLRQGGGVIVNVSSIYGLVGPDQRLYAEPGGTPRFKPVTYAVTKSAILGLTRYLATYWAGRNIRVNTLTPGGVFHGHDAGFQARYGARTPMGRMARCDELSGALLFLVSDASSYMTGSNLVVDGGWTAW